MNIFILDKHPIYAAIMQHDVHVIKMSLESAQIISAVLRLLGYGDEDFIKYGIVTKSGKPYGLSHQHHPCIKWVLESDQNRAWFMVHAKELCVEYWRRFDKIHACQSVIEGAKNLMVEEDIIDHQNWDDTTPFIQAMPEEYQQEDPVQAYRDYYLAEKMMPKGKPATWKHPSENWTLRVLA